MRLEYDQEEVPPPTRAQASKYWLDRILEIGRMNKMISPGILRHALLCTREENIGSGQGDVRPNVLMGRFDLFHYLMDYGRGAGEDASLDARTITGINEDEMHLTKV